jgi:predicted transcriptional regulator
VKVEKRNKADIYFAILQLLRRNVEPNGKLSLTRVAHVANLPYDRFQNYLSNLVQLGMIFRNSEKLVVTEKGLEFIDEYKKITSFLRRMGLLS